MGFSTNQWINRGEGIRAKGHRPVAVAISTEAASDTWSVRHGAKVVVSAWNAENECLAFRLSQSEVDNAADVLVENMAPDAQARLLQRLLSDLSNPKLLKVLAADLRKRVKLPNER